MPYSRFTLESSPQQPSPSVFPQSASSQPLSDCDSLHKPGKHSSPSHSGMLVLLLGPRCSGKETIARYLADHQHFQRVSLTSQKTSQSHHKQTATRQSALDAAKQQQQTDEGGPSDELVFDTASHFLDHATLHWRSHFVTTVRLTKSELEAFRKRPWVLLVSVEAPLTWRYARSVAKSRECGLPPSRLEDFIQEDDLLIHGPSSDPSPSCSTSSASAKQRERQSVANLQLPSGPLPLPKPVPTPPVAQLGDALEQHLHLSPPSTSAATNPEGEAFVPLIDAVPLVHLSLRPAAFSTTEDLHRHLHKLDLASEHRVRPSWDEYFMTLAELASLRSNCMKRRVGAVLISSKRKVVLSTGYNGTPRGMVNCAAGGCARCNSTSTLNKRKSGSSLAATLAPVRSGVDMEECLCLHAEENALLEAGRERAGAGEGGTLYCNTCPCLRCTVKIVQCGVSEVVYSQSYSMDQSSAQVFLQAGVQLRQVALKRDLTE